MRVALMTLLLPLALGCPGFGSKTIEELDPSDGEVPTWNDEVGPILMTRCAFCHSPGAGCGAPEDFRLDKYDMADGADDLLGAFEKRDRILARAVLADPSSMPPEGPIPADERLVIQRWVEGGAPQ